MVIMNESVLDLKDNLGFPTFILTASTNHLL